MSLVTVSMAGCALSQAPGDVLVTYALGSCVAIAIFDPVARVGGLLHYMLPESALDPAKALANPYMFADTGIPRLFRRAYEMGAAKRLLQVHLAGGALFQIGLRNCQAAHKILWKAGLLIQAEAVGGAISRTLRLEVGTGRVCLSGAAWQLELAPAVLSLKGVRPCQSAS